ncbi:MAG: EAL domain-containing protein [Chromatiales bacterium]|nr:MAG: EAL domain-containing protein [Chromatiales bacterium]
MNDSVGVPIVVLTHSDENLSAINTVLREGAHPAHCIRLDQPNLLDEALVEHGPELVMLFTDEPGFDAANIAARVQEHVMPPPLLLVSGRVDEHIIATALESGARDVVSLVHRNRLLAVIERELEAHRLRKALDGVLSSASTYKKELRDLMEGASEAIADVQEGIVVACNSAWAGLFGYADGDSMEGLPVMDMFRPSDQSALKGALVACLKGKWQDEKLRVAGLKVDGSELPLEVQLEKTTLDGDPAVRVIVPGNTHAEQTPAELLEQAVFKDPSTGFYHRHYFLERLEERLKDPLSGGTRAMVYIRPDNFSRVHDDIGLLGTEALLMRLAESLKEFMQPADIYGRFGGTMFVALLERGTINDAVAWAEKLLKTVSEQVFEVENQSTSLTCTIGLTEVGRDFDSVATLLEEAEQACRAGRDAGGNRVQITQNGNVSIRTRETDELWVQRLRHALMKNRLRLVHQPITSLTEEIDGVFDTRVRLLDEQDELVLPSEFLPAAERAGIVKNIDRWVIGASFSFCAAKQPELAFVRLSRDSVIDPTLMDWLLARQQKSRIRAEQICFQVAEDVVAQQLKQAKQLAEDLRGLGFRFAVDHVGTGRDSAQLIRHVPMDYVKIDGSLMQGLHRDADTQKTVGELTRIAKQIGIRTVAERVEDANTMAVLWQLGIAYIQGNYTQLHGVVLEDTMSVPAVNLSLAES